MWFAKWFGGRKEVADDDEPARFSAPVRPEAPAVTPPASARKPAAAKGGKSGFDPYNSGSFERRNAWERINRR
jgi:hypothetical protein